MHTGDGGCPVRDPGDSEQGAACFKNIEGPTLGMHGRVLVVHEPRLSHIL